MSGTPGSGTADGGVPLRVTLVGAILLLVTLALVVVGLVGTTALRTYLLDRVDEGLRASAPRGRARARAQRWSGRPRWPGRSGRDRPRVRLGPEHGHLPDGDRRRRDRRADGPRRPGGVPADRAAAATLTAAKVRRLSGRPVTVPDTGGAADWRVLVRPLPGGAGAVTVATSLEDVEDTVARLRTVTLVVSLVVLVLLGVLGYVLVRSSLRRLVTVETTAEAIAAGDLTRRVPGAGGRSEVGRLAAAFNTMVDRIEAAFAAQRRSEALARTAELTARRSETSARASEERMRRFVADASHELRTPLTSIRGFAELYRQGAVANPAAVRRAMSRIESEADRMGLLVEDLLLLARLDQQRPLERRPVDLLVLAADAVHDAGAQAPGRPVRLDLGDTASGPARRAG